MCNYNIIKNSSKPMTLKNQFEIFFYSRNNNFKIDNGKIKNLYLKYHFLNTMN